MATSPPTRHSERRSGASAASKARFSARGARSPKKTRRLASCRAARPSRKRRRNRRESTRTGRKKPGLQAIQREPSGDRPPPGTMTWTCGMMGQRRAPGVKDGGQADARAEMLRVGGDGGQRLGGGPEQEVVDGGLIVERDRADRSRQGEDDVVVGNRQQLRLAVFEPLPRRRPLALRAVAVAAGIVGDARMRAVLAALDMAAERCGAAGLDRRHHLQLAETHMASVGLAPRRPMGAKDVGDLQGRPRHAAAVRRAAIGSRA